MRVALDISPLAWGQAEPQTRAGIVRAIESLLYELLRFSDCELTFCAPGRWHRWAEDYVAGNPHWEVPRVCSAPISQSKGYKSIAEYLDSLRACRFGRAVRIPSAILLLTLTMIDGLALPFERNVIENQDIYHSSYNALPRKLRGACPKRFLTIYDLIPLLHAPYVSFWGTLAFKQLIQSISPEDWVLAISEATKQDLCEYRKDLHPEHVIVTHLAASDSFYPCHDFEAIAAIQEKCLIPHGGKYILSLNTLEPRKNMDRTIRCFGQLVKQEHLRDLYLVLAGGKGWKNEEIYRAISEFPDLQDQIILPGYVPECDLVALYSGALLFAYPSLYEGFGLPPLEAMQCGVPVVTSNTSSLPEVVGDAGIMVPPTDADALCQAFLDIYRQPTLREELAKKSIERAKQFSWRKCAQETVAAYRRALEA